MGFCSLGNTCAEQWQKWSDNKDTRWWHFSWQSLHKIHVCVVAQSWGLEFYYSNVQTGRYSRKHYEAWWPLHHIRHSSSKQRAGHQRGPIALYWSFGGPEQGRTRSVRQNMENKFPALATKVVCKSVNGKWHKNTLRCYFSCWHCCLGSRVHQWHTVGRLVLQRNHWQCQWLLFW
jgi:hypothetical protein